MATAQWATARSARDQSALAGGPRRAPGPPDELRRLAINVTPPFGVRPGTGAPDPVIGIRL